MNWGEATKFRLQVFAIMMSVMCPVGLVWMGPDTLREIASYSWPETPGKVQSVDARQELNDDRDVRYVGTVYFAYQVGDQDYVSSSVDLSTGIKQTSRRDALADVAQYHPGDSVSVAYDPQQPQTGILQRGIPSHHLLVLVVVGIGTVVFPVISAFIILGWIRARA